MRERESKSPAWLLCWSTWWLIWSVNRQPDLSSGDPFYGGALSPKNGRIPVPQGPAPGIDPDPDVIKTYRLI
jgi:L-alanine-DL-glutamate epimerase-like enolase superfamily enzyme